VSTTCKLILNQGSAVDTTPIVHPDAFRYLEKPTPSSAGTPRGQRPSSRSGTDDPSNDVPVSAMRPPRFVVPLAQNTRADESGTVQLTGKLEGYPFPTVSWFKDGKPLPASTRLVTNYNMSSGLVSLKINDVQLGDTGNYTVFAANKVGQDQTYGSLSVNQLPGIDNTSMVKPEAFRYLESPRDNARKPSDDRDRLNFKPPKFVIPLKDAKLNESQPAVFACKVEGYPKPKVTMLS
jgi:hypothetical protein